MTLVVVLERLFRSFLRRRVLARTHLEPELQFAVSRFAGYCFIVVGFFFAFKVVHLDLSSLAVVAGGLGVGIGFGLQNIVSNFISGLIILAERLHCHRPSHRGRRGRRAGPRKSTCEAPSSSRTTTLPSSSPTPNLIANPVTNWSYGDPKVRLRLPLGVAYGSDVEKLRQRVAGDCRSKPRRSQRAAAPPCGSSRLETIR